jgi:sugar O-acyltransferase (sialic acid O-acetyltransferase NeuD family)
MNSSESGRPTNPHPLVIYGGGGHGKSVIDLIQSLGQYELVGVIDDALSSDSQILGVPVLGDASVLEELIGKGISSVVNAVGGIGDLDTRIKIFQVLQEAGFDFPTVIHPTATVEPSARLSPGVQILPQAYVGTEASVGFGVIVNNGAIISHDCQIGDYSGIAPGAMLAGEVRVEDRVQIGMGVTVNLRLSIGEGSRIGNSAVIKQDVPANTVVRAGSIWPPR